MYHKLMALAILILVATIISSIMLHGPGGTLWDGIPRRISWDFFLRNLRKILEKFLRKGHPWGISKLIFGEIFEGILKKCLRVFMQKLLTMLLEEFFNKSLREISEETPETIPGKTPEDTSLKYLKEFRV